MFAAFQKDSLKLPSNILAIEVPQTRHILPFTVRAVFRFCSRYLYFIEFKLFLQLVTFLNKKCYPSALHVSKCKRLHKAYFIAIQKIICEIKIETN